MKRLLAEYLEHLRLARGYSEHTLAAYERDILDFMADLEARQREWPDVTRREVNQYLATLRRGSLSVRSILRKISSLRVFFNWLVMENHLSENPFALLDLPKTRKSLPRVISPTDIERLFQVCDGPLEAVVLELLYGCGLRVSELLHLTLSAIDLEGGTLRVLGKGSKERLVPLGEPAISALETFITSTGMKRSPETRLLLRPTGHPMTRKDIYDLVKALGRRIGRELHPHAFRHSFATHMLENGADLRVVQELLGHADIATTQVYTQVSRRHLRQAHANVFDR